MRRLPDGRHALPDTAADRADAPATAALPPLDALLALDRTGRRAARGVRLAPHDALEALLPALDGLEVVAIDFPAFTDGRGFSHARRLRAVHRFAGEVRAIGDVRPDQARQMIRCGFDALEFAEAPDEALLARLLGRFDAGYQPSYPVPGAPVPSGGAPTAEGAPGAAPA